MNCSTIVHTFSTFNRDNPKNRLQSAANSVKFASVVANDSAEVDAGIAQLVEHNLAKVGVASSNLVSRSKLQLRIPFLMRE